MSATIVDGSRKALEEKVDVGGRALNEALAALAESLGSYGFRGDLKLQLTVSLDHDTYGKGDTVLERSVTLHFKRG